MARGWCAAPGPRGGEGLLSARLISESRWKASVVVAELAGSVGPGCPWAAVGAGVALRLRSSRGHSTLQAGWWLQQQKAVPTSWSPEPMVGVWAGLAPPLCGLPRKPSVGTPPRQVTGRWSDRFGHPRGPPSRLI